MMSVPVDRDDHQDGEARIVLRKASLVKSLNRRHNSTSQDAMPTNEALKPTTPQPIIPINELISLVRERGSAGSHSLNG